MTENQKRVLLTALAVISFVLILGALVAASVIYTVGIPASELAFSRKSISIAVGDSVEIPITYSPKTARIEYFSYNDDFVTVADNRIVGVGTGGSPYVTTTVEARSGKLVARLSVTVYTSSEAGVGADYVITLLEANDTFDGYENVLKVFGKNHGSTLTEAETAVESNVAGYEFSGEWFFDAACTQRVVFSELAPVSRSFSLYTEPRFLRDGTTRQTKGGKFIDVGIDLIVRMTDEENPMLVVTGLKYPELPYSSIQIPDKYYFNGSTRTVEGIDSQAFDATKKNYSESDMGDYSGLAETLLKVTMPSSVKVIGAKAFNGLGSLATVETRLPKRALALNEPDNPRAPEYDAEKKDAEFTGIGEDAFAGTAWLEREVTAERNRTVGSDTLRYYSGAYLSNCLVAVDDTMLARYNYRMHFFPLDPPTGRLAITAFASGLRFGAETVFVVGGGEAEAYRALIAAHNLQNVVIESYGS